MKARDLMLKATRAASSAKILLDNGDVDGACDRAYYAMFNAARAVLLVAKAPVPEEIARTHHGLISAFSLHLVKTQLVPVEFGRMLNKVEDLRMIADYKGDPLDIEKAEWAVEQSHLFISKMHSLFMSDVSDI